MTYNELKEEISCAIREITSPTMPKKGRERLATNWIAKSQALQDEDTKEYLECLQSYMYRAKKALKDHDSDTFHKYFKIVQMDIDDWIEELEEE